MKPNKLRRCEWGKGKVTPSNLLPRQSCVCPAAPTKSCTTHFFPGCVRITHQLHMEDHELDIIAQVNEALYGEKKFQAKQFDHW